MAKAMFKELSTFQSINLSKADVAELFEMIKLQRSKNGFINDLDQDIEQNVINEIACPTLILHSSYDNAVNIEHTKYAHSKIKNSVLKMYDNKWGHLLWLGQESYTPIKDTLKFLENE
jgi:esterase/lipase